MNRYLEIFNDLEAAIIHRQYLPGTKLPSENQLAKNYGVSRETIRKALVLLVEQGYIQKQQGKGSIVLGVPRVNFPIAGLTSYKEIFLKNHLPSVTHVVLLKKTRHYQWTETVNELFPFHGEEVWQVIRQREVDGEAIILDKDYLLSSIVPDLTKAIAEDSLYSYIEGVLGLEISYAQKEFTVEPVTEEDHRYIDLAPTDTHVVVVRSQVFLQDTTLFQYTESRHRLDKFKFVEFARRRKN